MYSPHEISKAKGATMAFIDPSAIELSPTQPIDMTALVVNLLETAPPPQISK